VPLQAGLRAVHALGPAIRRAISGNLEEDFVEHEEPQHRVRSEREQIAHFASSTNPQLVFSLL